MNASSMHYVAIFSITHLSIQMRVYLQVLDRVNAIHLATPRARHHWSGDLYTVITVRIDLYAPDKNLVRTSYGITTVTTGDTIALQ